MLRVELLPEVASGVITQDEHRHYDKEVQTLTDETVKRIDDALAAKDKEIMQV